MGPVREKVAGGRMRVEVAVLAGNDVGYCVSSVSDRSVGEVDSIYVKEEYRDAGIGGTLLDRAVDWIKEHPVKTILLSVTIGNEDAPRFYERHGFRPRTTIFEWKG
ncbi:MAG TPA: GNAT family N-acetyltransferase, partial [Methanomassiliicoccales archaeon]|nr:GNAT family N-acetyltransferase [Methanomassiliicoccales archaeon]